MNKTTIPEFEISEILDKTTFVITGVGLDKVGKGSRLSVLAVGNKVKGTNAPLVLSKATLEVTSHTGAYVIARPYETQVEEPTGLSLMRTLSESRKVPRRLGLEVDESALSGNPSKAPIKVGDPVIRDSDLAEFVLSRTVTSSS